MKYEGDIRKQVQVNAEQKGRIMSEVDKYKGKLK